MASVNKVILVGNVGKDPVVRSFDGKKVAQFSVATSVKSREEEFTEWHNIVAWDQRAEIAEKYIHKGTPVYLEGSLRTRKYTSNDGVDRSTTEIVVTNIQLLGGSSDNGRPSGAPAARQYNTQNEKPFETDDDLPAGF